MKTKPKIPPPSVGNPRIALIKRMVAEEFGVDPLTIDGREKTEPLPMIRHVAMHLARRLDPPSAMSLPYAARAFKMTSHASILHAIRATKARMATSRTFKVQVAALEIRIRKAIEASMKGAPCQPQKI